MKLTSWLILTFALGLSSVNAQQELPQDKLQALFPAAASFKASKKEVKEAKRAEIESAFGAKLADADLQPQFYIALKAEGPAGVIYLGKAGETEFGVAIHFEGAQIAALKIFAPANSPLTAEKFLQQFEGKTVSTVKPPAAEQKALVEFLSAQNDGMQTMEGAQKSVSRKIAAAKDPLADEPAVMEKAMAEYAKLLAAQDAAKIDPEALPKMQAIAKDVVVATQAFSGEVKAAAGDWAKIDKAFKTLDSSCEKCHGDNMSAFKKKRKELAPPRGASDFVVGKDLVAPAGQDAAAQALATEVKKAIAIARILYSLK